MRQLMLTEDDITSSATAELAQLGIHISNRAVRDMMSGIGMDSNDVGLSPAPLVGLTPDSISNPIQVLQTFLPGFVRVLTGARKIDELVGIQTIGNFEDEELVQGVLEPRGVAIPYGDYTNVPFASWNATWERRTVVRFEAGMQVGYLEELRTARARIATAAEKRVGSSLALDIQRNRVGFYGFNSGNGRTYGFLNDPNLPAYVTATNGASASPLWSSKTFLEIIADIRQGLTAIQIQSQDTIDPEAVEITLALPTAVRQYLTVVSTLGNTSVRDWIKENYPKLRIVTAPELNDANGGASAAYFYAESVDNGSTDDNRTFSQLVPSRFLTIGVEKRAKSYIEDFANATAGVLCKRPFAVYRLTGI
jgi:hypothetical protein